MRTLMISNFCFDSLVDWNSVKDIQNTYPSMTEYEANISVEFCKCKSLDRKALLMFNLISSVMSNNILHGNQVLFITELINSVFEDRDELINKIQLLAEATSVEWQIMLIGS